MTPAWQSHTDPRAGQWHIFLLSGGYCLTLQPRLLEQGNDIGIIRDRAAIIIIGVDDRIVELHLVDAAVAPDEFAVLIEPILDSSRQTGGSWCVVSLHAVLDRNPRHHVSSNVFVIEAKMIHA